MLDLVRPLVREELTKEQKKIKRKESFGVIGLESGLEIRIKR